MTEPEKLKHAKNYIEMLANGINPLDGKPVPENDVINNVRLSRCFFYVADVLDKVATGSTGENAAPKKRVRKAPFALSLEQRERFEYSSRPISATEIAKRLTALIDTERMVQISQAAITSWLVSLGALVNISGPDDRMRKRPTPDGNALGISIEERVREDGTMYNVVVYDLNAQHFVIDNLDAILEHSIKEKAERAQRRRVYDSYAYN
jgi:hypothetical protein